jgi:hypothetical protein
MSVSLFHQVGHNASWNLKSFNEDGAGDGLILSPVHQDKNTIENLDTSTKQNSLFDPQYYLPNSQKKKLSTYQFFPETISNGFSTTDFASVAAQSAKECVDFQVEQDFRGIIVPTRYIDQMLPDYLERQEEYTVLPFLSAIDKNATNKPIYITLALTSHMILNKIFRTSILNWVTGFPEVSGVYLLVSHERDTKQIKDHEYLLEHMRFINTLRSVGLDVVVGHQNTESLLYSLIDGVTLTFGSFENTRIFSVDKFIARDEERRGPKPRIYLPGLLNWVLFFHAKDIRDSNSSLWDKIYEKTAYGEKFLSRTGEPHFMQPDSYMHHFLCFYSQIRGLSELNVSDRARQLNSWIESAIENHKEVSALPVQLDAHGNGDHLQHWLKATKTFYDEISAGS